MTDEFESILRWGGSPQATCSCGRVHYTASGDFMEPGELEGLEAKRKEQPDKYIPDVDNSSIGIASIYGVSHVWNCKCGSIDRIESFVWDNRTGFLAYYKARSERELRTATACAAEIDRLQRANKEEA